MSLWLLAAACSDQGRNGDALPLPDGAFALQTRSGDVVVRVLREAPEDAERPALIIGLHGYGMDERQIASLVNIEPESPHIFVAVRGFEQLESGGFAWFPIEPGNGGVSYAPDAVADATNRVFDTVDALEAWLRTDPDRVYLVGFSQGAATSLAAAMLRPADAAGFVAFAGTLPYLGGSNPEQAAAPVLVGHGSRDPAVRAEDVDLTVARLIEAGRHVEIEVYSVPHVVSSAGRRDIAQWIDDRVAGIEVGRSVLDPLSSTGTALKSTDGSPEALVASVFERAIQRGGVSGNPDGDITVYKFFDYNCPSCRAAHQQLPEFLATFPNVRLVAVDVPVFGDDSIHATALTFSLNDPRQYKAAYETLLSSRGRVGAKQAIAAVDAQDPNAATGTDLDVLVDAHQAEMQSNIAAMNVLGIAGTPGFVVVDESGESRSFTGWDTIALAAHLSSLSK